MQIRKLTDTVSVSPQLMPRDIHKVAGKGFCTVICNRPDGEAVGQPTAREIAEAGYKHGLHFYFIPIIGGTFEPFKVRAFGQTCAKARAPILAYCRSGTRSASLWALSQVGTRPAAEILEITDAAGYDLSQLAARLG